MFPEQGAIFREAKYEGLQVPTQQYWYYIIAKFGLRFPEDEALLLKHVGTLCYV